MAPRDAAAETLAATFARIHPLYARHAARCVVTRDEARAYYLGSHEVRAGDGYRTAFGGVEIKKNYVSAHLMPIYLHPELLDGLAAALRGRMQGKSCFNFKTIDDAERALLAGLIDAAAARFSADGRIGAA